MQVADHPAEPRGFRGIAGVDFRQVLRLLRDCIDTRGGFEKNRPVIERMLQIESELPPILRHAAPAALGEGEAVHAQLDARFAGLQDC